jgi:hypothetical protein
MRLMKPESTPEKPKPRSGHQGFNRNLLLYEVDMIRTYSNKGSNFFPTNPKLFSLPCQHQGLSTAKEVVA